MAEFIFRVQMAFDEIAFIVGASPRRYIEVMNAHPTIMRLLRAILLSALAGGLAYGLTVWLSPDNGSALLVAFIVAVITALGVFAPHTLLKATSKDEDKPTSAPDTYFDTSFSIHKDEGWND